MRVHLQYIDNKGAILIMETIEYPAGHASEQELRRFAKEHFETLNLALRVCRHRNQHLYHRHNDGVLDED